MKKLAFAFVSVMPLLALSLPSHWMETEGPKIQQAQETTENHLMETSADEVSAINQERSGCLELAKKLDVQTEEARYRERVKYESMTIDQKRVRLYNMFTLGSFPKEESDFLFEQAMARRDFCSKEFPPLSFDYFLCNENGKSFMMYIELNYKIGRREVHESCRKILYNEFNENIEAGIELR